MTITDLATIDRPREKLARYGALKLTDTELMAVVLGTGTRTQNVLELSQSIITRYSREELAEAQLKELIRAGVGSVKSAQIVAAFELGRRMLKNKQPALIVTPHNVWDASLDIRDLKKEHLVVFYLDTHSQLLHREVVSVGTVSTTLVHPREIFEPALQHLASKIILAHNHPSGIPHPSTEDTEMTMRITEAGMLLGIEVIDHVIVTAHGFWSMKEHHEL